MHAGRSGLAHTPAIKAVPIDYDGRALRLRDQVQSGLNLFLPLKNPAQMPALIRCLRALQPQTRIALESLHYVHFARFVPTPDGSTLMVITTYDGELDAYLMDFVGTMGEIFTAILEFVRDAPRLPVQKYPRDFCEFVRRNNIDEAPWSAYPQLTVLDVLDAQRRV